MKIATHHTPGPWWAETGQNGPPIDQAAVFAQSESDDAGPIADCRDYDEIRPVVECQANARLIAAAPSCDEAARCYVRWIDEFGEYLTDSIKSAMENAFGAKLRAAIRAAEGSAP